MPKHYDKKWTGEEDAPVQEKKKIRSIDGGRAIQARDVVAEFGTASDEVCIETDNMAAFAIFAIDDEGFVVMRSFIGRRCPYSPALLSDVIKKHADTITTDTVRE